MNKINVNEIGSLNLKGRTIAFPTDTVYGVGAMISDLEAIEKIYSLKKRDYSKPLAVLISSVDELYDLVSDVELLGKVDKFWPGAITFIFKKKNINNKVTGGLDTVGIRIPKSKIALEILKKLGPLAVTSVNYSGESSAEELQEVLKFDIDYVVTNKVKSGNVASTVVDISTNPPMIIREGTISFKELQKEFPNIRKKRID